jgi:hypothetical protein
VLGTRLLRLERRGQVEDGVAVLDGDDATGGEGAAVTDAVHLVEDRLGGIAGPQEVRVQGVHHAAVHRAPRGHQRLAGHLSAEHPLAILLRLRPRKTFT